MIKWIATISQAQAILIDNGIPFGEDGHFSADIGTGGSTEVVNYGVIGVE